MALGTLHQTITTGAVFAPDVWSNELQIAREDNLVMAKLVKRRDVDVKTAGATLELPFVSNINANAKTANTEVTFNAPTETKVTVTLNRHFESSFLIEDRLDIQSQYDLAQQYREKAGFALAKQVDTDLTGLYSGLTQTTGTGMTSLTEANVVRAIQYLDDANAPESDRAFVVKPATMNHLRQISRFTEYQMVNDGSAPMIGGQGGMVRNVFGVPIYMSTNIAQVSGTPGIVHNLLFHRDFAVLAMQKDVSIERERKATWLGTAYVGSALWGYAELRDDHGIDVRTVVNT
ncbi:MAG: hypothetical protein NUV80_03810 [Candidatus Berkelbacteria bacterium]|nr:hypothetical protein [Candidatus Berkelbacteria bacterium]